MNPTQPTIDSGNVYVDSLLNGTQWFSGTNITYSFNTTFSMPNLLGYSVYFWTDETKEAARNILRSYESIIDLTFTELSDNSASDFILTISNTSYFVDSGFSPTTLAFATTPSDIRETEVTFNADRLTGSLDPGGIIYFTGVHELGHALGLAHPHDGDKFPGVTSAFELGTYNQNQAVYTAMSYNQGFNSEGVSNDYGHASTPMAFDIAALQWMYGANISTATGNDVYYLPSSNTYETGWQSIWDYAGTDTISAINATGSATIDLRAATGSGEYAGGYVSRQYGIKGGFTVAYDVDIENAVGGSYADTIIGNSLANTLRGYAGNDSIDGGAGRDTMYGGTGNDRYTVDNTRDRVIEVNGQGTDTVTTYVSYTLPNYVEHLTLAGSRSLTANGNSLSNNITGNGGSNTLRGYASNDTIRGYAGNDYIDGGTGRDTMYGGTGNDRYRVDNTRDRVIEVNGQGTDTVTTYVSYTLPNYVEHLTLAGSSSLTANGNSLSNNITGNGGSNTLRGYAGNDSIDGGTGRDTMYGGTGNDRYRVDNTRDRVIEVNGQGTDTVTTYVSYTLPNYVEHLTLAGSRSLTANGNSLSNNITGNGGSNTLRGYAGNDSIDGGAGRDTMYGGTGNDRYTVDNTRDRVIEVNGQGTDTVTTYVSYTLPNYVEHLTLAGSSSLTANGNSLSNNITGNGGSNTLRGYAGNDTIRGYAGNDYIDGGTGRDTMYGGTGNDRYRVDNTGDRVIEFNGQGTDTVTTYVSYTLPNYVEHLTLAGSRSLTANGNSLSNNITGNGGSNTLRGYAGNDSIDGGAGRDTMYGGTGNDSLNGGSGDDILFGEDGDDILYGGNSGNDNLNGGSGDDTLYVGYAAGGVSNTTLVNGGIGFDWLNFNYWNSLSHDVSAIVIMADGDVFSDDDSGPGGEDIYDLNVNFSNIEALYGTRNDDYFVGDLYNNLFVGGRGNDYFNGGISGVDYISYVDVDFGNDIGIYVDLNNTVSILEEDENVSVYGAVEGNFAVSNDEMQTLYPTGYNNDIHGPINSANFTEIDIFKNIDNVIGSNFEDDIYGNEYDNRIVGGHGSDYISGGGGDDTFVFYKGDTFLPYSFEEYTNWDEGVSFELFDRILDYQNGTDYIAYHSSDSYDQDAIVNFNSQVSEFNQNPELYHTAEATAVTANIDINSHLATFAEGSGTTLKDALNDVASAMDYALGGFAIFKPNQEDSDYYLFIQDDSPGLTINDVVIELYGTNNWIYDTYELSVDHNHLQLVFIEV